jgi:putative RNA 2'-phosphotransferase
MNEQETRRISKFMSLVLRHSPEKIGIQLDENGWVDVEALLNGMRKARKAISRETLEYVVENNNKKRFAFNEDGTKIRASQGHSVKIELGYDPVEPPEFLYHGTVQKYLDAIMENGIQRMSRHHVHLSHEVETATVVGNRRGSAIILTIHSRQMQQDGHKFYISENGVWLTDEVPGRYITRD